VAFEFVDEVTSKKPWWP